MKLPVKVEQPFPIFNIYWTLTDFCNYKCNYCVPRSYAGDYHFNRKPGYPSDEQIIQFLDNLGPMHVKDRFLCVKISGGEPTIHPMLPYIINRLKEYKHKNICIITNGSRNIKYWQSILPIDEVIISLHPEYVDMEKINELSWAIIESKTKLNYNLAVDPKHWDATVKMYDKLDDRLKHLVKPKVLFEKDNPHHPNYHYTTEQLSWMNSIINQSSFTKSPLTSSFPGFYPASTLYFDDGSKISTSQYATISLNQWHRMKGWDCHVASQAIKVQYSGKVFAGICMAKQLGTIDNFKLDYAPLSCTFTTCKDLPDLATSKYINNERLL